MIRATKIELGKITGGDVSRLRDLCYASQRMHNRMWQLWLHHHIENDSAAKIAHSIAAFNAWRDNGKQGEKPAKWDVQACDAVLSDRIYQHLMDEFPEVSTRTKGLAQTKWRATLTKRKSTRGSLPGWAAILFAHESVPSSIHPQPVPFDKINAKLFAPTDDDPHYRVRLSIERDPLTVVARRGNGRDACASVHHDCVLLLHRRKMLGVRAIVDRIIDGTYTWKGSQLLMRDNKLFVVLSYEMPSTKAKLLDDRTLHLRPGRKTPWFVYLPFIRHRPRLGDSCFRVGGFGRWLQRLRGIIAGERYERMEHYRWAGSNQKGRGRKRAEHAWTKMSSRYKNQVKRYNRQIAKTVIRIAVDRQCATLVYHQPTGERRNRTFLGSAGVNPRSQMTWDWHQMATLLANKCEEHGIAFFVYPY